MFVSVFFVAGVLLVSRACSLDGDVLGLILGGIDCCYRLTWCDDGLQVDRTQKKSYQSDGCIWSNIELLGVVFSSQLWEFVHSP